MRIVRPGIWFGRRSGDSWGSTLARRYLPRLLSGLLPGLLVAVLSLIPAIVSGAQDTCGQPSSTGAHPMASDAFVVLTAATGAPACMLCVCDVDTSGSVTATDALSVLKKAVGYDMALQCPACAVCGDGVVGEGEECDDAELNSDTQPDACRTDCLLFSCGDGVRDFDEECEPAGTASCGIDCSTPTGVGVPVGFQESIAIDGLQKPTSFRFASDGRIFVAEKRGVIKVFDSLDDPTPDIFADMRTEVHNYWDRGLLALELHPDFPAEPYIFVLYTYDAPIGGQAPTWGLAGEDSDDCPSPPGASIDGCVVSGRLSRLEAFGNSAIGSERVMIEDWCQQYPSHSIGDLRMGDDGALYVSGGDGSGFTFIDYGQRGYPWLNPCNDAPVEVGELQAPPSAEGGSLRSQDMRTPGDPTSYAGTLLRVNPDDSGAGLGEALPDNPLFGGLVSDDDRVVAYGLRNPFRFAVLEGSEEIWIGDVGWRAWEEINHFVSPTQLPVANFGWPCYEGDFRQAGYDEADLTVCEELYDEPGAVTYPHYSYHHDDHVEAGDLCGLAGSAISGMGVYTGTAYPSEYQGALLFSDASRDCIWAMYPGPDGLPDPSSVHALATQAPNPVDLEVGPNGELFYADVWGGAIRSIAFSDPTIP